MKYDIIGALGEVLSSLVRVMLGIIGALGEVLSSLVRVMPCIIGALGENFQLNHRTVWLRISPESHW